jgi:hypothetical protein
VNKRICLCPEAPPFRTAEMDLLFGQGISREGGLIDLGVEQGIVRKSGAWYTCESDPLGQGKENARNFLRDNPDLANEIEKKIREKLAWARALTRKTMRLAAQPMTVPGILAVTSSGARVGGLILGTATVSHVACRHGSGAAGSHGAGHRVPGPDLNGYVPLPQVGRPGPDVPAWPSGDAGRLSTKAS